VQRTHKKEKLIKIRNRKTKKEFRKKIEDKKEKIIIELYSPIKIKENKPPLYSVLKPETNSDSPSEKSKGDRLHSAKQERLHLKNKIIDKNNNLIK